MTIVPFEPVAHLGFVRDALRELAREWPYTETKETPLERAARGPDPVMVAVGGEIVGWVIAAGPQRIGYAYVNYPMRRSGIMTSALLELGFDIGRPIAVDLWSRAASRMVERGTWRLFPTILG